MTGPDVKVKSVSAFFLDKVVEMEGMMNAVVKN